MHITIVAVLQVQAHQIDHAIFRFFKLRSQKLCAKVACNLHHAFGRIFADGIQFLAVDDVVLNAVLQSLLKKRPRVIQRHPSI